MFRRSLIVLDKSRPRTVIRDPRKKRLPAAASENNYLNQQEQRQQDERTPQIQQREQMAFEPSRQNQQSIGSTMGNYALAGFGMSMGFAFVGALFGGF